MSDVPIFVLFIVIGVVLISVSAVVPTTVLPRSPSPPYWAIHKFLVDVRSKILTTSELLLFKREILVNNIIRNSGEKV